MSKYIIPEAVNIELERTPGAVAVSGLDGREPAGKSVSERIVCNFPAGSPLTNSGVVEGKLRNTCADTAWAVLAECKDEPGKFFGKRIYCGKEWCKVCGIKRSKAHNRRIARVLPKAMQIENMGYFVVEFPDKYRKVVSYAYSKKALRMASNKIIEVLAGRRSGGGRKGGYFSRGLLRWHWFGDKMTGKYNPHANVLVDGLYLADLEDIKMALRSALNCPDLIVYYSFSNEPAAKFAKVEYITRATFKEYSWSPYMANQLYGFRNSRWWGSWKGESVWSVDSEQEADLLIADALEQNTCPDCGGELSWTKPFNAGWLNEWSAVEIGETGYYRIPIIPSCDNALSPDDIMRLDRLKELHIANMAARIQEKETLWQEIFNDEEVK